MYCSTVNRRDLYLFFFILNLSNYMIKQLLNIDALDMVLCQSETTNIDLGFASANIGIISTISHHVHYLNIK